MSASKVAVILPSRGLMFSRTAEEIVRNLRGVNHRVYFAHRKPIPDCFELPVEQALADEDITHLWIVEDDMILPDNLLVDMLGAMREKDAQVMTCDYPVTKDGKGAVLKVGGEVVYCGTGCLLVKREVFDILKPPYFRSDIRWSPLNYGKTVKLQGSMYGDEGYGLHDVTFGIKLYRAGIQIHEFRRLGQRKLLEMGKSGTNDGAHKTEEWKKIKPNYQFKKIMGMPLAIGAKGALVTVDTPTGGIRVSKKHADNLIKQGLATPIDEKKVMIDDSEVIW